MRTSAMLLTRLAIVAAALAQTRIVTARQFVDLGSGCPGSFGIPHLGGVGLALPDSPGSLSFSNAKGGTITGLLISLTSSPSPYHGCTLFAFPPVPAAPILIVTPFTASPSGWTLPWTSWPETLTGPSQVWFQVMVADPLAVGGVAVSNGLVAIPPPASVLDLSESFPGGAPSAQWTTLNGTLRFTSSAAEMAVKSPYAEMNTPAPTSGMTIRMAMSVTQNQLGDETALYLTDMNGLLTLSHDSGYALWVGANPSRTLQRVTLLRFDAGATHELAAADVASWPIGEPRTISAERSDNGTWSLYVNGAALAPGAVDGTYSAFQYVNVHIDGDGDVIGGIIDDIRVFNY